MKMQSHLLIFPHHLLHLRYPQHLRQNKMPWRIPQLVIHIGHQYHFIPGRVIPTLISRMALLSSGPLV